MVPANTIDKDYVLGHFLNSFYSFEKHRKIFVFKGGTCLRKCYFPDFRFSEDLDFTLLEKSFLIDKTFFERIATHCVINSGIRFGLGILKINYSMMKRKGINILSILGGLIIAGMKRLHLKKDG